MTMMIYDSLGKFGEQSRRLSCFQLRMNQINQFLRVVRAIKHFLHESQHDDWYKSIVKFSGLLGADV